jgi:trigger factor
MQIDYQQIDPLNARMTIRIPREDYEPKFKTSLLEYRKKASFKGFRKGKTPVGYLEKLFGQDVLSQTISDMLREAVNDYLEENKVPFIGQPLPAKEQEPLTFDPKELVDAYTYTFDIGLLPDFDIKGLDHEIEWYDVPVADEQIDKEWLELLKRKGSYVQGEVVEPESRVSMRFREMENLGIKPEGRENTRMIYPDLLREEIKTELIGRHVGDIIRFDPDHFLKNGDALLFKRYYFEVLDENDEISEMVEGQIMDISRLQPAEATEEFFSTTFDPGTVTSEEQAREVIAKVLKQRNDAQSDTHLRHMIEHQLMDANQFDLPLEFIDRLISMTEEGEKQKSDPEKQANAFRWHFIKEKLFGKFEIDVTQDEILRAAADRVYDRFGSSMPYEKMKEIIERYISDRDSVEQLRNSILDTKLFYALKDHMPVVKKEITHAEFKEMQDAHRHEH